MADWIIVFIAFCLMCTIPKLFVLTGKAVVDIFKPEKKKKA